MSRPTREHMFLDIAEVVSRRSTCLRNKVGAVITDENMENIVSIGYNGNYRGGPNKCDTNTPGACGCIHAEINALLKSNRPHDAVMFITESPCLTCAKSIINSGIKTVYYRKQYRVDDGLKLLIKHIKAIQIC